jgi:hypothetical protein
VLFHLQDPAWIEGFANLQALSSTFLSRNYTLIQDLYNWNPSVAIWLSRLTGWGMIFWEFFLIPLLVISRATRVFAIAWGLLFFTISLIFFNLSFLPYYEYVFWALLFFNRTAVGGNLRPLEVFFDDRCNLCDRTMRTILALDVFNVVQPRPVSKNTERLIEVGLSQRDALTDLYAWDESRGRLVGGFDFYLLLTQRVLILLPARFILEHRTGSRIQ